jgi:hypothetical protein
LMGAGLFCLGPRACRLRCSPARRWARHVPSGPRTCNSHRAALAASARPWVTLHVLPAAMTAPRPAHQTIDRLHAQQPSCVPAAVCARDSILLLLACDKACAAGLQGRIPPRWPWVHASAPIMYKSRASSSSSRRGSAGCRHTRRGRRVRTRLQQQPAPAMPPPPPSFFFSAPPSHSLMLSYAADGSPQPWRPWCCRVMLPARGV